MSANISANCVSVGAVTSITAELVSWRVWPITTLRIENCPPAAMIVSKIFGNNRLSMM
jgi:hypothetical protein